MKRLFMALNLDGSTIKRLQGVQGELRRYAQQARLVAPELLHITLAFLGECPLQEIPRVIEALNSISVPPFAVELTHLNYFERGYSSLWFIELAESTALVNLRSHLVKELGKRNIRFDSKPFRAHLTIARDVRFSKHQERDYLRQLRINQVLEVKKLDLMSSSRKSGQLVYQVLHSHQLRER